MKITAIMNLKGGTAKTTTTINMAAILCRYHSHRILLVDADSQCNLTEFMTGELPPQERKTRGGLYDLLTGKSTVCFRTTVLPRVDILPATDELMNLDIGKEGNEIELNALAEIRRDCEIMYDDVIIDCPPAFSATSVAALLAADQVVIPMKLDAFGIRGMANLMCQIENMKSINPKLQVAGILPTMYYRSPKMEETECALRGLGLPVFHHIRRSAMVDDMTFAQKPLILTSPKSGACKDYKVFVEEFLKGGEQHGV